MNAQPSAKVESLRDGERDGSGAVLRITPVDGPAFHAIAVPQDWYSYTGPTWVYVIEAEDGLTLIDAGSSLVVEHVETAFRMISLDPAAIDRVVISHGHIDHDGGALGLAKEWNVEVWAHILWDRLRFHDRTQLAGDGWDRVQDAIDDDLKEDEPLGRTASLEKRVERQRKYSELRRDVNVARLVEHGDEVSGFTFYHTPGHAPDELTVQKRGVLFAGDHILPEITPHPTIKSRLPEQVRSGLPDRYQDEDKLYGLDVYLQSLMMIAGMSEETLVMPAHRLINRGKLNVLTARRAREIAEHHLERIGAILEIMGSSSWSLGDLTKKLFAHRRLHNVYEAALHETMAHVELLVRHGDVLQTPENRFVGTGTQHYLGVLSSA